MKDAAEKQIDWMAKRRARVQERLDAVMKSPDAQAKIMEGNALLSRWAYNGPESLKRLAKRANG